MSNKNVSKSVKNDAIVNPIVETIAGDTTTPEVIVKGEQDVTSEAEVVEDEEDTKKSKEERIKELDANVRATIEASLLRTKLEAMDLAHSMRCRVCGLYGSKAWDKTQKVGDHKIQEHEARLRTNIAADKATGLIAQLYKAAGLDHDGKKGAASTELLQALLNKLKTGESAAK